MPTRAHDPTRHRRAGWTLLVAALLLASVWLIGRRVLVQEGPPAFFVEPRRGIPVWLAEGFEPEGLRQFLDGSRRSDVTLLTARSGALLRGDPAEDPLPLEAGQRFAIRCPDGRECRLESSWMSAESRMALGTPLHPDRMSLQDWQALPGIGPKLAQAIETDRQIYGDFGEYHRLLRVSGIGPKRLEAWRAFFSEHPSD